MADSARKCLKILCIHGYRQSASSCKDKLGAFRKSLKKLPLEFVYITAPNKIPKTITGEEAGPDNDEYGWWFSKPDDSYDPLSPTELCKGFDSSIDLIHKTFKEQGPFDGVFAFSQGACLASILCAMKDQGLLDFRFAILVAAFKSRSATHSNYYSDIISCPTLHVYGDTDSVIPKENSEDLVKCFANPMTLNHTGGHFVPAASQQKKVYLEFLGNFIDN
ncbi:predicted protein [Nematostella vectensis]|uniref:Serine hydrolase domain-containing protein n=1 Tax=Nematostella vectensis TaxID=45351 RepID=A7SDP4_NEMVE|nr:predicted protein [Nematostella vectensis]|eukprot:XP_001630175.1 predicted protein [Nematostella vectensis]